MPSMVPKRRKLRNYAWDALNRRWDEETGTLLDGLFIDLCSA